MSLLHGITVLYICTFYTNCELLRSLSSCFYITLFYCKKGTPIKRWHDDCKNLFVLLGYGGNKARSVRPTRAVWTSSGTDSESQAHLIITSISKGKEEKDRGFCRFGLEGTQPVQKCKAVVKHIFLHFLRKHREIIDSLNGWQFCLSSGQVEGKEVRRMGWKQRETANCLHTLLAHFSGISAH